MRREQWTAQTRCCDSLKAFSRSACGALHAGPRSGFLAPAVVLALTAVLLMLALVIDRLWLQNASVEMDAAVESAALAACRTLVTDDHLRTNHFQFENLRQRARQQAAHSAAQNRIAGRKLRLHTDGGSVRLGRLVNDPQTGRTGPRRFLATAHRPTAVVVTARRSRENGNPVALFLRELSGVPSGDVSRRVMATVDNHVVGIRPLPGTPAPLWPFAIRESPHNAAGDNGQTQTWNTHIDQRAGVDRFTYDETIREVRFEPDGIPEIILRSPVTDHQLNEPTAGNVRLLEIGNGFRRDHLHRQLAHGVSASDVAAYSGELRIDTGPVSFTTYDEIPAEFHSQFQKLIGQCRMVWLYSEESSAGSPQDDGVSRVTCRRLVAGRVMSLRCSRGRCEIVFQPGTMTTRTAVLAKHSWPDSRRRRFENPYVYKLQLIR